MRLFLQRHRWITVLTVALLLFATSGLSLSRMTCLMGGHSVLSIGQGDDCCPAEENGTGATVEATCCAFTEAALHEVQLLPTLANGIDLLLMALDAAPMVQAGPVPAVPVRWLESRPPPIAVMERLRTLRILLV